MTTVPAEYRLRYADWLKLPDDGRFYEILEGELLVTPPPNIRHQRISRDLGLELARYLRETGRGEVLFAPVGVRLSDEDVLEPDLVVVLKEHAARIGTQVVEGAPDLIVEVLSAGTARRDLGSKRAKYEAAGVPEYWIVDPERRTLEVLVLVNGSYERHALFGHTDVLRSDLLADLEIVLAGVFPR